MTGKAEPLFDTSGMNEILVNDIRDLSVHEGVFRFVFYTYRIVAGFEEPCWVPVQPVAMPISAVAPCAAKALKAISASAAFDRGERPAILGLRHLIAH